MYKPKPPLSLIQIFAPAYPSHVRQSNLPTAPPRPSFLLSRDTYASDTLASPIHLSTRTRSPAKSKRLAHGPRNVNSRNHHKTPCRVIYSFLLCRPSHVPCGAPSYAATLHVRPLFVLKLQSAGLSFCQYLRSSFRLHKQGICLKKKDRTRDVPAGMTFPVTYRRIGIMLLNWATWLHHNHLAASTLMTGPKLPLLRCHHHSRIIHSFLIIASAVFLSFFSVSCDSEVLGLPCFVLHFLATGQATILPQVMPYTPPRRPYTKPSLVYTDNQCIHDAYPICATVDSSTLQLETPCYASLHARGTVPVTNKRLYLTAMNPTPSRAS